MRTSIPIPKPISVMLNTVTLSLRLWATTWFVLAVLYFLGMLAVGITAGFGGLELFAMAGSVTFLGSLASLVMVALLLPMLRSRRAAAASRESVVFMALLLVTLVCGLPAVVATDYFMPGSWLGGNAGLLVFPAAALVAAWVAVFVQQENIVRYANPPVVKMPVEDIGGDAVPHVSSVNQPAAGIPAE